jgi:hypothetical protein
LHFQLFVQNQWVNFSRLGTQIILGWRGLEIKCRGTPFAKGDNSKRVKYTEYVLKYSSEPADQFQSHFVQIIFG